MNTALNAPDPTAQTLPSRTWFIATCWFKLDLAPDSDLQRRICRLPAYSVKEFREIVVHRCLQDQAGVVTIGPVSEAFTYSVL